MRRLFALVLAALLLTVPSPVWAQSPTAVQFTVPTNVTLIPISATAAVNTATTLTIPAAVGMYNYVCYLAYQAGADATGGAITNAVTTSTNFNSFAVKFSQAAGVNLDSGVQPVLNSMGSLGGCVKSTAPGTATTFVSSAGLTHETWTWYGVYFQWPF